MPDRRALTQETLVRVLRTNRKEQQPMTTTKHAQMNLEPQPVYAPHSLTALETVLRRGIDQTLTLAPDVANAVLEQWNAGNRRRDEVTVQRYRRDMEAGRWLRDGEIGFRAVEGEPISLGNGQHRLAAQFATGTTQTYRVRVFTDADEFALYVLTVDGGKNRSLANVLSIFGVADSANAALRFERVVNAMHAFVGARVSRLSKPERLDFAVKYQRGIKYALGLPTKMFKAHVLAAIALGHTKKRDAVESVISDVIGGNAPGGIARQVLRELPRLNDAKGPRDKDRALAHMIRALHDAYRGKSATTMDHTPWDSGPMREALTAFVSAEVASQWSARNKRAG